MYLSSLVEFQNHKTFYLNDGVGEDWALQLSDREWRLCLTRLEVLDSSENFGPEVPIGAEICQD